VVVIIIECALFVTSN